MINRAGFFPLLCVAIAATLFVPGARAEDIDPDGDGSQYAWGENVGWLNAEPSGQNGPGLEISHFFLAGWLWGEIRRRLRTGAFGGSRRALRIVG